MTEIIVASAFLDFGGVPDERWLRAWRISDAADHRSGN